MLNRIQTNNNYIDNHVIYKKKHYKQAEKLILVLKAVYLTKIHESWIVIKSNIHQKVKKKDENKLVTMFVNHCATLIQANFKGYKQRKYYRLFLPTYRRLRQILYSMFMGWKVRRVLKLTTFINKIEKIKKLQTQNQLVKMRISKRQFVSDLGKALKHSDWVQQAKKMTAKIIVRHKIKISQSFQQKHPHNNHNLNQTQRIISQKSKQQSADLIMKTQRININKIVNEGNTPINYDQIPIKVNHKNTDQYLLEHINVDEKIPIQNNKTKLKRNKIEKSKEQKQDSKRQKVKCLTPTKQLQQFEQKKLNHKKTKLKIINKTNQQTHKSINSKQYQSKKQEEKHLSIKQLLKVYSSHYKNKIDGIQAKIMKLKDSNGQYSTLQNSRMIFTID